MSCYKYILTHYYRRGILDTHLTVDLGFGGVVSPIITEISDVHHYSLKNKSINKSKAKFIIYRVYSLGLD